jgi:hypothetical protein
MMMKRPGTLLFVFFLLFISGMAQVPFTPGNIIVNRVGDKVTAMGTDLYVARVVFLDEYTPSGSLVQSIPLSSGVTGSNRILTQSAGTSNDGWINLSVDGQYLVVTGASVPAGSASVLTPSSTNPKIVGLIKFDGTVNTTTGLTDFADNDFTYSAISTNGTDIWVGGSTLVYTTIGSTTSTVVSTDQIFGFKTLNITNGQLYESSSLSFATGLGSVGTGIPTTSGQVVTSLPGYPAGFFASSNFQFAFADLDASVAGPDVLYVADDGDVAENGGISKYSLVNNAWTLNGIVGSGADDYRGLTISMSGTTVTIYATRKGNNSGLVGGDELVKLEDATGYNGAFSGTPSLIASVPVDKASFRGVALVPQAPPSTVKVSIKAFLQGDYSSSLSRHKDVSVVWAGVLNANALTQPFNTASFGNYAGTESVSEGFFTSTSGTIDIVDWVLLELRSAATPGTVVARKAALIREDGQIVDVDGSSEVSISGVPVGNYYVVVRHRNHLGVRSATAIALSGTASLYDFTTGQGQAFQDVGITTNGAMQNVSGVFVLWGGNGNGNSTVRYTGLNNDAGTVLGALGGNQVGTLSSVYSNADLNFDGTVDFTGANSDGGWLLSVLGNNQATVISQHQ